jgi:hypothetical protein
MVYQALLKACTGNEETNGCSGTETLNVHYGGKDKTPLYVRPKLEWDKPLSTEARRVLIGTVAQTIQVMANDEKNCFDLPETLGSSKTNHICNIGKFVTVLNKRGSDSGYNAFDVRFHTNAEISEGHFDCLAIKSATSHKLLDLKKDYIDAFGGKEGNEKEWEVLCDEYKVTRRTIEDVFAEHDVDASQSSKTST